MKYEKPRNPAWPDWYDGKKINEVQFCYDFLESHPLKCIDGQFYTPMALWRKKLKSNRRSCWKSKAM